MNDLKAAAVIALTLAGFLALTYAPSLGAPFLFDDFEGIVRNTNLRALSPGELSGESPGERLGESIDWRAALTAPAGTGASGRPLVALTLAFDYARSGLDARSFRQTNLAFLYLSSVCLGLLAFFAARERGALSGLELLGALACAALWIVHPLQGAAVHQIVYRGELMMAFAFFATLLCAQAGFASGRARWLVSSVLFCAFGMLSKENMFAAPLVCLLWDRAREPGANLLSRLRARPAYYAGLASTWGLLALAWASGDRGEAVGLGARGLTSLEYLATQADVVATYARWTVAPFPLAFDYSDWPIASSLLENALSGVFVLALLGLALVATVRRSLLGLAGLAGFLVLAPTSSVVPIAVSIAAEHRMVFPLSAVTALLSFGAVGLAGRTDGAKRVLSLSLLGIFLGALLAGSRFRNALFLEPEELWRTAVELRPKNTLARSHLVEELQRKSAWDEALAEAEDSLALDPNQPDLRWNMGVLLARLERPDSSETNLRAALEGDPSLAPKQMHEAMRAWSEGRVAEALAQVKLCLQIAPELASRERLRAVSLQAAQAFAVAQEERLFAPALALEITDQLPRADLRVIETRAAALAALGRFDEAKPLLEQALELARSQRNQRAIDRLSRVSKLYARGRIERRAMSR
ncbi:MAG: hypothetical protein AAF368_04790 [Planctomycetota bacterium]